MIHESLVDPSLPHSVVFNRLVRMKCGSRLTKEAQAEPITTRVQNMDGVFHTGVGTETPAWLQTCWRTKGTMRSDVRNTYVTYDKRQTDGNLQTMLVPSSAHCGPRHSSLSPGDSDRLRGLRNERAKVKKRGRQNKSAAAGDTEAAPGRIDRLYRR